MKKTIKRTIAIACCIVFSVVIFLGSSIILKAEESTKKPTEIFDLDKKGSITIYVSDENGKAPIAGTGNLVSTEERNNLGNPIPNIEFGYLKIADCILETSDTGTVIMKYHNISSDIKTKLNITGDSFTSDDLNTNLAITANKEALVTYLKEQSSIPTITTGKDGAESTASQSVIIPGKAKKDNLPLGLYIVFEKNHPQDTVLKTIDPFFVSIPMTDSITAATTKWNYDVVVYPKTQTPNTITLDKTVADITSESSLTFAKTATVASGDTVTYQLETKIPEMSSLATATQMASIKFSDTLPQCLSYVADSVSIKIYSPNATAESTPVVWEKDSGYFSVTMDNTTKKMEIEITENGLKEINPKYSLHTMKVYYNCILNSNNSNTVYGDNGNTNTATVSVKRNSNSETDARSATSTSTIYTYGLEITKKFSGNENHEDEYNSVKFKLVNTSDNEVIKVSGGPGEYYVSSNSTSFELVPNSQGKIIIYGLEGNSYELIEIQTAKGYSLLREAIPVDINSSQTKSSNGFVRSVTSKVNNQVVNMRSESNSDNAIVPLTVTNTKSFILPQTGGAGAIVFTVLGAIAVGGAIVVLTRNKKKA